MSTGKAEGKVWIHVAGYHQYADVFQKIFEKAVDVFGHASVHKPVLIPERSVHLSIAHVPISKEAEFVHWLETQIRPKVPSIQYIVQPSIVA